MRDDRRTVKMGWRPWWLMVASGIVLVGVMVVGNLLRAGAAL
jgi:hypothetical protein